MGATFSRLKNWIEEILTYQDLNAEIDHILDNLGPSGVDDYSTNATQMRITTDPGEVGSESLATSLAGELERLRFAIREIKGTSAAQWYSTASTSLTDLSSAIGSGLSANRIASGKTSSQSSQLRALVPGGTTASLTLTASGTPFVYYINDSQYSLTANVVVTGLSGAPASNNTCLVNDAQAADNQYTQLFGQHATTLTVDSMASELTSRVGTFQAFLLNNGAATEPFVGYLDSTTAITVATRGPFIDTNSAAKNKIVFSDNDTISLLRLTWVFLNTTGGIGVTYNVPTYAAAEPASPTTGDYWFDMANDTWKTFNSTAWVQSNSLLIGYCAQNSTACIAARTLDPFVAFDETNSMRLSFESTTQIAARSLSNIISVGGNSLKYGFKPLIWDITTDLDSGIVEAANTFYYLYVKESGAPVISDIAPSEMRARKGLYHSQEMWRCVGVVKNNASSNFEGALLYSFLDRNSDLAAMTTTGTSLLTHTHQLNVTASGNALATTLLDRIGNYPSDLIPTFTQIRNNTESQASYVTVPIKKALSVTIPTGATLGQGTAANAHLFYYLTNVSSQPALNVSAVPFDERTLQSVTEMSASATSGSVIYGTSASSVPLRFMGTALYANGLNGTWSSGPSTITVDYFNQFNLDTVTNEFTANPSSASFTYVAVTSAANAVVLGPGDWKISGQMQFNGGAGVLADASYGIFAGAGANSNATPALLSANSALSILGGLEGRSNRQRFTDNGAAFTNFMGVTEVDVRVSSQITAYMVPGFSGSSTVMTISGNLVARRIGKLR